MKNLKVDNMNNNIVIVAKGRSKRPMDKFDKQEHIELGIESEYSKRCPFCRGNEKYTPKDMFRIDDESGWLVKSVINKFPIVDQLEGEIYGTHEVMIDTYRHNGNFYNMTVDEFRNMFIMYKNRYTNFIHNKHVEYVSIFKNFLRQSGASLIHPHSQIISLSIVPPEIVNEINVANEYYKNNKISLYKQTIKEEIQQNKRIIHNGNRYLVIVPKVSKYSGEIRIIFKENIRFEEMDENYIIEISNIFKILFENIHKTEGHNPFNICIHTHPSKLENEEAFNVHIHIIPRKYSFGGFELGTGLYVSSIYPENLAKRLKF